MEDARLPDKSLRGMHGPPLGVDDGRCRCLGDVQLFPIERAAVDMRGNPPGNRPSSGADTMQ